MQIQRVVTTFLMRWETQAGANRGASAATTAATTATVTATAPNSVEASTAVDNHLRIAIFRRQDTMPTFPGHWAGCSGSIEAGEVPWEAAFRELREETNWQPSSSHRDDLHGASPSGAPFFQQDGLFLDVPHNNTRGSEKSIRVYPFIVTVSHDFELELRGTEHDCFDWVSVAQLEALAPSVPSLALAFHHATRGKYWKEVTLEERKWASDRQNGATTMSRKALELLMRTNDERLASPARLSALRPTMVTIVNSMKSVQSRLKDEPAKENNIKMASQDVMDSLGNEARRSVEETVNKIVSIEKDYGKLKVATFSRSSTIVAVLKELLTENPDSSCNIELPIICGRSTPGDEGEYMTRDLNIIELPADKDGPTAVCADDDELKKQISEGEVDILLVGADCVLVDAEGSTYTAIINKVGTRVLIDAVSTAPATRVLCCTDRYKIWDDAFPPPLERDLFEVVPASLNLDVMMPAPS